VAVGFCGTQGSTFFSPFRDQNSYENGYWLIYENTGSDIDDGVAASTGSFRFVQATHDNMDGTPVVDLGPAVSAATVGLNAATGGWATFRLTINPSGAAGEQILAKINGIDVHRGSIPTDGRTQGAFMVGFREAGGGVGTNEGTWVDNIQIANDPGSLDIGGTPVPVGLSTFGIH
jgi:hypothetical protein